jgi:hypothetical protein
LRCVQTLGLAALAHVLDEAFDGSSHGIEAALLVLLALARPVGNAVAFDVGDVACLTTGASNGTGS